MMSFGTNYIKAVKVNEKKRTDDKPYKLTIIPTLIDWIQQALVGGCHLAEAKQFGLPLEALNALKELNECKYFESGSLLRLKVSPTGAMCIEEQLLSKDSTIMNNRLKDNLKLEWQISRKSNSVTDYLRTILKYLPDVIVNYHRTCLQAMRYFKISRIDELENDSKRLIELVYALNFPIEWTKANDIDYLAYRSGMNLESIIANLDNTANEKEKRSILARKLNDQIGIPQKKIRGGLFLDVSTNEFTLGCEQIPMKNDRDITIRLMHRIIDGKNTVREIASKNSFLDDDSNDSNNIDATVARRDSFVIPHQDRSLSCTETNSGLNITSAISSDVDS